MNYWYQRTAFLHLSPAGREIFGQTPDSRSFEVFVEWADELGLWVLHERFNDATNSVRLVKWSHFDSAVLDVIQEEPEPVKVIGFRGRNTAKNQ